MRALTRGAVVAGLLFAAGVPLPARAAPCGRPDLVDMVPPDGARDVPPNATLGAHYTASADYLGEDVVLVSPDGSEQAFTGTFDATEGLVSFVPPAPLQPGGEYTVRWPVLRGINAAAPGTGGHATFVVGTSDDTASPTFEGVSGLAWDLERETGDCTDAIEERFVFDIELGAAADDGGRAGLTLILFQTSGPGTDGGSVPVLARALPPVGTRARVALPVHAAVGRVCFAGLVRDLTGRVSNSADREACVETTQPPFFRGCALAGREAGRGKTGGGLVAAVAVAALAIARARRRRRAGVGTGS